MEFCGFGGSGGGGSGSGSDRDLSDAQKRAKRYHRHTAAQIQMLESTFKACPHPDEKQRLQLSRDLGLAPRQIKFWFQNRRTQSKAQQEKADNCVLRAENDKIRCENIAIREALRNVICPSCGSPPMGEDSYFDEQKLRIENAQLKDELDRLSSMAAKYIGRPIAQLPPVQPLHMSSLDLSMGSYRGQMLAAAPSLDLDLLPSNSSALAALQLQPLSMAVDKSIMVTIADNALDELLRLSHQSGLMWFKSRDDGRDELDLENYAKLFPRAHGISKFSNSRVEASRDSRSVMINSSSLVDLFMDSSKWAEIFPTIVTAARTVDVVSPAIIGAHNGSLLMMHGELQVLSPMAPSREVYFFRYCRQVEEGLWAIVDFSYDVVFPRENDPNSPGRCHRFPSGCLIQDQAEGWSQVTWVEHVEIEDRSPAPLIFRDLLRRGLAFGAQRWLVALQRMCERLAFQASVSPHDHGARVIVEKVKLMQLAQRMVSSFCAGLRASQEHRWATIDGMNDVEVRLSAHPCLDPRHPGGVIFSAATSIWLPVHPQNLFNFFRDERTRHQWDLLSKGVQVVRSLATGRVPGNCVSVLKAFNSGQNDALMLQESCTDAWNSLVVYSPVDVQAVNLALSGEDTSCVPLLPSGFAILPAGRGGAATAGAASSSSSSGGGGGGSLLTIAFQIILRSRADTVNDESLASVNSLIGNTVQQIKAALHCSNP